MLQSRFRRLILEATRRVVRVVRVLSRPPRDGARAASRSISRIVRFVLRQQNRKCAPYAAGIVVN